MLSFPREIPFRPPAGRFGFRLEELRERNDRASEALANDDPGNAAAAEAEGRFHGEPYRRKRFWRQWPTGAGGRRDHFRVMPGGGDARGLIRAGRFWYPSRHSRVLESPRSVKAPPTGSGFNRPLCAGGFSSPATARWPVARRQQRGREIGDFAGVDGIQRDFRPRIDQICRLRNASPRRRCGFGAGGTRMGHMSNHGKKAGQASGFKSKADRERDEALRGRYGSIGISAVKAAKAAKPNRQHSQQASRTVTQQGWDSEDLPPQHK